MTGEKAAVDASIIPAAVHFIKFFILSSSLFWFNPP